MSWAGFLRATERALVAGRTLRCGAATAGRHCAAVPAPDAAPWAVYDDRPGHRALHLHRTSYRAAHHWASLLDAEVAAARHTEGGLP